jgi:hypothetical protein
LDGIADAATRANAGPNRQRTVWGSTIRPTGIPRKLLARQQGPGVRVCRRQDECSRVFHRSSSWFATTSISLAAQFAITSPLKGYTPMKRRFALVAALLAGVVLPTIFSPALAACSDKDIAAKVTQLSDLLAPLVQRNPAEAQKITEEMTAAMTQDTNDRTCAL